MFIFRSLGLGVNRLLVGVGVGFEVGGIFDEIFFLFCINRGIDVEV